MNNQMLKEPSQRCLKVGEEIRRALSAIFQNYFFSQKVLMDVSLTVTEVQMSPDLKHAKTFIMPLQGKDKTVILEALKEEAPRIRHLLSKKVVLKSVPQLDFRLDTSFDAYASVSQTLEEVLS